MSTVTGQDILEALYAKLIAVKTVGTFYALLGGRIYMAEGPLNAALPLAVVSQVDTPIARTFSNIVRVHLYQVDLYGKRSAGQEALGDIQRTLFDLLDGASLTVAGHDRGLITCENDGTLIMEDDALRIMSEWEIESMAS